MRWSGPWAVAGCVVSVGLFLWGTALAEVGASILPATIPLVPAGPVYWTFLGAWCGSNDAILKRRGLGLIAIHLVIFGVLFLRARPEELVGIRGIESFATAFGPYFLSMLIFTVLALRRLRPRVAR